MKNLYIQTQANDISEINLQWIEAEMPRLDKNECIVQVAASGINPSDALATMGYFKHAIVPRVPGRDFSGTIVAGPHHLMGKNVWGTGGAAGISFNGTQAEYIKLEIEELAEVPEGLDLVTAGAQCLPYVTAYYSLVKRARIKENETVLVIGALGQVGSAAMSICHWKKSNAIALIRGAQEFEKARAYGWNAINTEDNNLDEKILAANQGRPVQAILNSVGNIYWEIYMNVLSEFGRIITIGARETVRNVDINLFHLYRNNQDIIGINTVSLDFKENAKLLQELKLGFEENKLRPLPVDDSMIFSPEQAVCAYQQVVSGKRAVIKFMS